jgi:pyrroloquinoline quinone (PQQ) biosynthesis protein C
MTMEMPVLKRSATVTQDQGRVVIDYLTDQITLEGKAAELFGRVMPHLDGATAVDRIADNVAETRGRVQTLLEALGKTGVVGFVDARTDTGPTMTGEAFYALHRRHATHWLREVYEHPIWEAILSGRASRAQVLGFAFEKYHYIEGAYEHMAVAAANASPEMMPHLARHFIEEYQHGDIYRKGLRSLFPDEVVLAAQPLPSTRALVNYLRESAARDSFSYYAGNELLQMTENTGEADAGSSVETFYAALKRHYPYTDRIVDAFIAHTHADQKLGHADVFLEMCRSIPPLSPAAVRDAMSTVRSMAEHLVLFLDGLDVHYRAFPTMPRLPCDLMSE